VRAPSGDAGTGLVSTIGGVTAFLAFLLLATQILLGLHATSTVTGVAHDGARDVARADASEFGPATAEAEASMRSMLGRLDVSFDWSASTPDTVVLHVHASTPRVLPVSWDGPVGGDEVDRTVRVRRELVR
jgi:hypothetical protein